MKVNYYNTFMSQDINQEFFSAFQQNEQSEINLVKLRLVNPRISQKKLTLSDLFEIKEKCTFIRKFSISEEETQGSASVIFFFQCVQDITDFYQEHMGRLTFSLAYIDNQDYDDLKQNINNCSYKQGKLQREIQQQGFQFRNGLIAMKRRTSLQGIVQENENLKQQEESTHVNSDLNLSVQQDQKKQQHSKNEVLVKQSSQISFAKPFVDGILIAGALYGGLKLLRYFVKF